MRIKSDKTLTCYLGGKHSYTITAAMGVVSHFPRAVCESLIEKGAKDVTPKPKKSSAEVTEADPAE